jgi:hypothetical protein
MQLVGATKLTVAVLLTMIVMACIVAVPPAEAGRKDFDKYVTRQNGDLTFESHYQRPENRTKCLAHRWTPNYNMKKHKYYLPGRQDAWDCYDAWRRGAGH